MGLAGTTNQGGGGGTSRRETRQASRQGGSTQSGNTNQGGGAKQTGGARGNPPATVLNEVHKGAPTSGGTQPASPGQPSAAGALGPSASITTSNPQGSVPGTQGNQNNQGNQGSQNNRGNQGSQNNQGNDGNRNAIAHGDSNPGGQPSFASQELSPERQAQWNQRDQQLTQSGASKQQRNDAWNQFVSSTGGGQGANGQGGGNPGGSSGVPSGTPSGNSGSGSGNSQGLSPERQAQWNQRDQQLTQSGASKQQRDDAWNQFVSSKGGGNPGGSSGVPSVPSGNSGSGSGNSQGLSPERQAQWNQRDQQLTQSGASKQQRDDAWNQFNSGQGSGQGSSGQGNGQGASVNGNGNAVIGSSTVNGNNNFVQNGNAQGNNQNVQGAPNDHFKRLGFLSADGTRLNTDSSKIDGGKATHWDNAKNSGQKQILNNALNEKGATPQEKALIMAMGMQEDGEMSHRTDPKTGQGDAENFSVFNVNRGLLRELGKSEETMASLNPASAIGLAGQVMLEALRNPSIGAGRLMAIHRGGLSDDPNKNGGQPESYDIARWRNTEFSATNQILDAGEGAFTDDQRWGSATAPYR